MKYFSTFSGIGGFELGIQAVMPDAECVGYSEIDKYAIQVYQHHFPNHKNYGDITAIDAPTLPDFDLLVGGFPCQSFSIAGQRKGFGDSRGTLFFHLARIIRAKRPGHILLENVAGLLSHDSGYTYKTILSSLAELGYDTESVVLNSFDFGSTARKRVFIHAVLRNDKTHNEQRAKQTEPLYALGCEGIGDTGLSEPEDSGSAAGIVRTFARLPDWLDGWDAFYPAQEDVRQRRHRECS